MVLMLSLSALSLLKIPLCISSMSQIKQERFSTIRISESNTGYLHLHSNVIC